MTKKRTRKVEAKALKLKKTDGKKPASRCSVKAPAATAAPETQPAAKPVDVKISAAKGRPMLSWVGKRPLFHVRAFPAQLVERHGALQILGMSAKDAMNSKERVRVFRDLRGQWNGECWEKSPLSGAAAPEDGGLLFHGDNKEVLAYLLANGYRGKVNLVYIDPPFDSGADYVRKVNLRGPKGTIKLDGDSYCLGEQIQYGDIWNNDGYLQFMYERFLLLKELLAEGGFLMAHFDSNRVHYMRVLLDEVFGEGNYINEIIWQQTSAHNDPGRFGKIHNNILLYGKSGRVNLNTRLGPPDTLPIGLSMRLGRLGMW